jgi:hypothetical protein
VVFRDDSSWRNKNDDRLDRQVHGYVSIIYEASTRQGTNICYLGHEYLPLSMQSCHDLKSLGP